jgi:predicted PurR-regulated permease PerM
MAEKSRGTTLTIFAVLFALLAISNFLKPFHLDPSAGFVFLGTKLTGTANAVMGPLFGIILLVYAYAIWAMRKFALPIAYVYAPWVILNTVLFTIKNHDAPRPSAVFAIASIAIGIGVPFASAIVLHRRRNDLK